MKTLTACAYFLISSFSLFAQEVDIVLHLKQIEEGEIVEAHESLKKLAASNPADPSVKFLYAVLTSNGTDALNKYMDYYKSNPGHKFADAALYRIFSYYFAVGSYKQAEQYLNELKSKFPQSPYIAAADRALPDEEIMGSNETEKKDMTIADNKKVHQGSEDYNFTIQAGAFLNNQNAQSLKNKFEDRGLYSSIFTKEIGGSILNVVVVGKFIKEEDAGEILQMIDKEYNLKGRIIPLNSN